VVTFTSVFGGYDRVRAAPAGPAVLFTDQQPSDARGWDVQIVRAFDPSNLARSNRAIKLQPHQHVTADRTLYVDGNVTLTVTPAELLAEFVRLAGDDHDVFTLRHSLGHTLANEPEWVARQGITRESILERQVTRYRHLGVPDGLPTAEARIILARSNASTRQFFDTWWREVREYSHRDQVSFPYAVWATGVDAFLLPFRETRGLYTLKPHARPQLKGAA